MKSGPVSGGVRWGIQNRAGARGLTYVASSSKIARVWIKYRLLGAVILQSSLLSVLADDSVKPYLAVFGKPLEVVKIPEEKLAKARVELGRTLYHEKRLSRDNSISCNSCHDTKGFGVDGEKFSVGFDNHLTGRNSPTSFNAFMHIAQFWDCLLYTSPSPRDKRQSRMPSSA